MAPSIMEIRITATSVGFVSGFISFLSIPLFTWFSMDFFQDIKAFAAFSLNKGWVSSASVEVFKTGQPVCKKGRVRKLRKVCGYTNKRSTEFSVADILLFR